MTTRHARRSMIRRTAIAGAMGALAFLAGGGALASHNASTSVVGTFEIDGNFDFDALPGALLDWENAVDTIRVDDASGETDDTFGGGSKEQQPDGWTFDVGSVPGKTDFTRLYFSAEVTATEAFVRMAFEGSTSRGRATRTSTAS